MMRHFSAIIFVAALVIFAAEAAEQSEWNNPPVKINILSKQIRLLGEGSLSRLTFLVDKESVILDELHNETYAGENIVVTNYHGRFDIFVGSKNIRPPYRIKIFNQSGEGAFKVRLSGEEREYPLPLVIIGENGSPRIYVWEQLKRYIIDSALAEYGMAYKNEQEAVMGLSHVILYRYFYAQAFPQHHDAHFCDLTHCQLYRGRLKAGFSFNDAWLIDHEKMKNNLFFHSRCGGITFGPGMFGRGGSSLLLLSEGAVRDRLWRHGIDLCRNKDSEWTRTISADELRSILFKNLSASKSEDIAVDYNKEKMWIDLRTGPVHDSFPPETVRLRINRVKGWSFLKSNNFSITEKIINGEKHFIFQGTGLGHGVGLCQHGALRLSQLGYDRYEIIEHYFPNIILKDGGNAFSYPPYLSYCIFNLSTGNILAVNHGQNFLRRKMPPGSIYKLIIALYLAKAREDIFNNYTYSCTGKNQRDATMPERCWKAGGHGTVGIQEAVSNSCNLYFASLYDKISYEKFSKFFKEYCRCLTIQAELPEITDERQWAAMLAGLDFRMSLSMNDYIQIVRFLNVDAQQREDSICPAVPAQARITIFKALTEIFTKGTASGPVKPYGSPNNYIQLKGLTIKEGVLPHELWGKTSTVVDGTNRPLSYGLFIGGSGDTGIIALLRKGNGNLAARWVRLVLAQELR